MNIVLTKDEMFTLSVRKANRRLKDEWIGFIGGYKRPYPCAQLQREVYESRADL